MARYTGPRVRVSRRIGFNYSDSQNTILSHDGSGNIETLGLRGNTLLFYSDYDSSNPDGVERMRIDTNGGLAIGTTSIDNTTRLTVVQANNDYPVARFDMSGAVNAIVGQEIRVTDNAANAANKFFIRGLDDTTTERFRFNTNGSGSMSGSLTQNSSDERLKEEIRLNWELPTDFFIG